MGVAPRVRVTALAWAGLARASFLDCSSSPAWSGFREHLNVATKHSGLKLDEDLVGEAQVLVQSLEEQGGMLGGAERFYREMCSHSGQTFCLYGAVNALFVVSAAVHNTDRGTGKTDQAQEYLRIATSLLGLQNCLDFMESTSWPIQSNDILANLNRSASEKFTIAVQAAVQPAQPPPPGSSLYGWTSPEMIKSLTFAAACSRTVGIVAVGTHPTLTTEAVTMLRDFGFAAGQRVELKRTLGITYKCTVFPEMCGVEGGAEDPIAALIGPFDAPPAYESYTMARISAVLEVVGRELSTGLDVLVCTSPYVICAVLQQVTDAPLLAYFGLPLLWKRPTDLFDNSVARDKFWALLGHLRAHPRVVLAVNNPLLSEQIAFQAPGAPLPVVRPHATFTRATYTPLRLKEALLVSRTKFLWVTLGCVLRHFIPEGFPVEFTIANSDSKLPFREMASHRAVVLVPWEHALMAFFEFYSMTVPLLMPAPSWAYRLVFDAEGNLGSTTALYMDVSPECDAVKGCSAVPHPYPPFGFASLESRRYWYQYSSFAQFPHVRLFNSIPEMLEMVLTVDLVQTSASMKTFNDFTFARSAAFWRRAARAVVSGHPDCAAPPAPPP